MALTIQEAIARVPFLAGKPDIKITSLSGGITNLNFIQRRFRVTVRD